VKLDLLWLRPAVLPVALLVALFLSVGPPRVVSGGLSPLLQVTPGLVRVEALPSQLEPAQPAKVALSLLLPLMLLPRVMPVGVFLSEVVLPLLVMLVDFLPLVVTP